MNILANVGSLLWRHKTLIAVALMAAWLIALDDNCVMLQMEQMREIDRLENELTTLKEQFDHDSRELERLNNDPRMAEEIARELYQMKREGEDLYLFIQPADSL